MRIERKLLALVAKMSVRSAKSSAGSASKKGYYQPKEPEAIAMLRKKKVL